MWSLPNIVKMNAEAAKNGNKFLAAVRTHKLDGKVIQCERCQDNADMVYPYYDIFSDNPKGVIGLCEEHDGYCINPFQGFFTCDACGRVMVENYTWERYCASNPETDEVLCLCCFAARELAKPENWIELTDERIEQVDFNEIRLCKHLLAVKQPVPKCIEFVDNVEMDSMSGGKLRSHTSCDDTPDNAVEEIRGILRRLKGIGFTKAIMILDAAYQFSVSCGVYVGAEEAQAIENKSAA